MEPVETSAASPEEMLISGSRPMATLPARRRATGRSSLASMVSSASTAKPSIEAREKPGTSIVDTIFSARIEPAARLRGTWVVQAAGRCCKTMDLAASRGMRLWNSLGMICLFLSDMIKVSSSFLSWKWHMQDRKDLRSATEMPKAPQSINSRYV